MCLETIDSAGLIRLQMAELGRPRRGWIKKKTACPNYSCGKFGKVK